jgi:hypothetical protein
MLAACGLLMWISVVKYVTKFLWRPKVAILSHISVPEEKPQFTQQQATQGFFTVSKLTLQISLVDIFLIRAAYCASPSETSFHRLKKKKTKPSLQKI